ncbi:MAG: Sulfate transporter [Candidatus Moranbacteria bacterium GW2011_GWC2_37_8]|nr:MAG: Sulfate transporter [Candidatus Moranbacteria bacterium GW2011_GWC2_37_8]KKQ61230.1 MAG: Sulfate transporter [Parcubacteria group bacterium GW2011_GWC1_38_22]
MGKHLHIKEKIKQNWKSGLTVAFVSIPLSISLAVAAGATPLMGVITAIWAGLFASIFGGSNFNIVGPTGALSGILIVFAIKYGVSILPLLAIITGLMTLTVYLLRWERYIVFIPSSVVHGFTLGVAFIIGLGQFNFAFGLKNLPAHENLIDNLGESLAHISSLHWATVALTVFGFIFLLVWRKFYPKVPGVMVLAPAGILLGYLSQTKIIGVEFQTLFSKFGDISGNLLALPNISWTLNKDILLGAAAISVVAILETLMSAKIADGMTKTKHNTRKEVLGAGVANIFSGLFGGLPATAALARTSLNVKSGANDKMSATISSICIFIISAAFLFVFKYLPLPVVASILIFTATQMVESEHFVKFYRNDKSAFLLSIIVAIITVVEDPIIGILIGSVAALLLFANKMSKAETEIGLNKDGKLLGRINARRLFKTKNQGDTLVYRFAGQLTYVNTQSHMDNVSAINDDVKVVVFSFRNLFFLDMDGMESIKEMVEMLKRKEKLVLLSSANGIVQDMLLKEKWFNQMDEKGQIFSNTKDALEREIA